MGHPVERPRRLRRGAALRALVRETRVGPCDFMLPLFVVPGKGVAREIDAMPGCFHFSVDRLLVEVEQAYRAGVRSVLLFGLPKTKDEVGCDAWNPRGAVQRAVASIRSALPDMLVATDVCLCAYTSHGHCGILDADGVNNDGTLPLLVRIALSHAEAGAQMVAPSDMMDGRVGAIRSALDDSGASEVAIMSYSVKYASSFYGPFREAAGSAPSKGDRSGYQMDPGNSREALREVRLDIEEGADIVMVKPALSYLDVIARVRSCVDVPVAAYSVSGEYSMIKAAAQRGWLDEERAAKEMLVSIRRAGADIIITYFATQAVGWFAASGG